MIVQKGGVQHLKIVIIEQGIALVKQDLPKPW